MSCLKRGHHTLVMLSIVTAVVLVVVCPSTQLLADTVFEPPYDSCYHWPGGLGPGDDDAHGCNKYSGCIGSVIHAFVGAGAPGARQTVSFYVGTEKQLSFYAHAKLAYGVVEVGLPGTFAGIDTIWIIDGGEPLEDIDSLVEWIDWVQVGQICLSLVSMAGGGQYQALDDAISAASDISDAYSLATALDSLIDDDDAKDVHVSTDWMTFSPGYHSVSVGFRTNAAAVLGYARATMEGQISSISIAGITPPETPTAPGQGPPAGHGEVGISYQFRTGTVDEEDEALQYRFDWGDGQISGWSASYPSGEDAYFNRTYQVGGEFQVRVQARDTDLLESGWSPPLTILIYPQPPGDDCTSALPIGDGTFFGTTDHANNDGSASCGMSEDTEDVWFSYTAPCTGNLVLDTCGPVSDLDTVVSVHTGCPGTQSNELECNDDCNSPTCGYNHESCLSVPVDSGNTYLVRVSGYDGSWGDFSLDVSCEIPPPANDHVDHAILIGEGSHTGTTIAATNDGSASCGYSTASPDVWYRYTADCTGYLTVDTCGSSFDTVVSIHDDSPGTSGNELACNDDCAGNPCSPPASCLSAPVTQGETYFIRVAGFGTATGVFTLDVTLEMPPPPNDTCDEPVTILHDGTWTGTTCGATESGSSTCDGVTNGPDAWYVYEALTDGRLWVYTCGSTFDTVLSVHTDCPATSSNELSCNDDCGGNPCGGEDSCLYFEVVAANTYLIRVSGSNAAAGDFTLHFLQVPANDLCEDAVAVGEGTTPFNTEQATDTIIPDDPCNVNWDVWYSYTATTDGLLSVALCGSAYNSSLALYPQNDCASLTGGDQLVCREDYLDMRNGCSEEDYESPIVFRTVLGGESFLIRVGGDRGFDKGSGLLTVTLADDCNANGYPDIQDINLEDSEDCHANGIPDECEIAVADGGLCTENCDTDCDDNQIPDACDLMDCDIWTWECQDCDNNGVMDGCQSDGDWDHFIDPCDNCPEDYNPDQDDRDYDGVGDVCDNCEWKSNPDQFDGDVDGIGDECDNCSGEPNSNQANWDGDAYGDICDNCPDMWNNDQEDVDGDGLGDACDNCEIFNPGQEDCQPNGIGDICDIENGSSDDCNTDGIPDDCQLAGDCDDSGVSDIFEICNGTYTDCDKNIVPDWCEIEDDPSVDQNDDGVLDACQCFPASPAVPEYLDLVSSPISQKIRYLSFSAGDTGQTQAIRVTCSDLPYPYHTWNGTQLWVQQPKVFCENAGTGESPQPSNPPDYGCPHSGGIDPPWFWGAELGCDPYWTDWTQYDLVHVWHEGIVPSGIYDIHVLESYGGCSMTEEDDFSPALTLTQSVWADVVQDCTTVPCKPPDGSTGIVDVSAILDKWKNLPGNIQKVRGDIEGSPAGDHRIPDQAINITDVTFCLLAFMGETYPAFGFLPPSDPPVCP